MQEEIYPCKSSLTQASLAQGTNVLMTPHPPLYSILLFPECHDFFLENIWQFIYIVELIKNIYMYDREN